MAAISYDWYNEAPPGRTPIVRPIIVLEVPATTPREMWETSDNIAFFRSSGSSNVGYSHFAGTWLPTFGLGLVLETYDNKQTGVTITAIERRILKMGHCQKIDDAGVERYMFSNKNTRDVNQLLIAYIDWLVAANHIHIDIPPEYLAETSSLVKQSMGIRYASRVSEQINNAYIEPVVAFMRDYFLYHWQVQLSYNLGGGIWTNQLAPIGFRLFSEFCAQRFNGGNLYNYAAVLNSINHDEADPASITVRRYETMVTWLNDHGAQTRTYTPRSQEVTKIPCRNNVSPFESFSYNGNSSKQHIFNVLFKVLINTHNNGGKRIFLRRPSTFSSKTKKRKNRKLFKQTLSSRSKKHKKNQFKH